MTFRVLTTILAVIALASCSAPRQPFPTATWHPASAGHASWGLPGVSYHSASSLHTGMSRAEVSHLLGTEPAPCHEAARLYCVVTTDSRPSFHIALRFDRHGRLDAISSTPVALMYSSPKP